MGGKIWRRRSPTYTFCGWPFWWYFVKIKLSNCAVHFIMDTRMFIWYSVHLSQEYVSIMRMQDNVNFNRLNRKRRSEEKAA